uniref:Uncharacterized protein n=1 Tax=Methanosarcina thermophila TaxID=2210 RepID=Q9UXR4_METTE|nr:hypothetical protein [Methanosarcina thermophila TM-1]
MRPFSLIPNILPFLFSWILFFLFPHLHLILSEIFAYLPGFPYF